MQISTNKNIDYNDELTIYFAHPWTKYANTKILDYLQNSRHLTEPKVYEIFDAKILFRVIENIDNDLAGIFSRCYSKKEDTPNVKWVTSFERKTECIQFADENTIILDFAQICDMAQIFLNCEQANEDMLAKYEYIKNRLDQIMGKEFVDSKSHDRIINNVIDSEQLSNNKITYSIVNRNISDILFCNGYLDGAFHYCGRAVAFYHQKVVKYVREDSFFVDTATANMLQINFFWKTSIFLAAHEAHHIELYRKFDAITPGDRNQIPDGLFESIFNWFVVYCRSHIYLMHKMWHSFGKLIERRSEKIVEDLYEAFSNDPKGCKIIDACKDAILSWGKFNLNADINKMTDSEYKEFLDIVSECYCDVMALYDLLDILVVESFVDIRSAITTILRIMVIEETNRIANELIKYMSGKINEIRSMNVIRLQLFFFAVMNESMIDDIENLTKYKFHNNIDWRSSSKANKKAYKTEPLMLGILKSCSYSKDEMVDFYEEMFGAIDVIHEYYYTATIYEVFHVYQNGFICNECSSVYIKSEGENIDIDDYDNGVLVTNLPSIIVNSNIGDTKKAGKFYLQEGKKIADDGKCIVATAPLSEIAKIVRIDQLTELFEMVRLTESKELFDSFEMVQPDMKEEDI